MEVNGSFKCVFFCIKKQHTVSDLDHMFSFRTMRVNWRLFRNKWTPGTWILLRKKRNLKRKVILSLFN